MSVQVGGFRLPFNGVGSIILLFVPLTMVLMKSTSEYMTLHMMAHIIQVNPLGLYWTHMSDKHIGMHNYDVFTNINVMCILTLQVVLLSHFL